MQIEWTNFLDEINELFVKITRDKIFKNEKEDFLTHVQTCLRLNKPEDWNYILASEDILEDSNTAISNFLKFGVSGPTKYNDLGEKYLRLYGALNAAYLQQQAILNLYIFFQCQNPKELRQQFNSLQVIELRHKLASHSANYDDQNSGNMHVFVPVRIELGDFEISYFNYHNDDYSTADLKKAIEEHLKLMCETYIKIVEKSVSTIYKSNPEKITEIMDKVNPFVKMTEGCTLMKNELTGEFTIIEFV